MRATIFVLSAVGLMACTTYRDELTRAQTAYDANDHETALALTRAIEPNAPLLRPSEQAKYYYLRGMANFRIGFRAEARHNLAMAREINGDTGALPSDWKNRMDEILATLNTEVYDNGLSTLTAQENEQAAKRPKRR